MVPVRPRGAAGLAAPEGVDEPEAPPPVPWVLLGSEVCVTGAVASVWVACESVTAP